MSTVLGRIAGAALTLIVGTWACGHRTTWSLTYDLDLSVRASSVRGQSCPRFETRAPQCDPFPCNDGQCEPRSCVGPHDCAWDTVCVQHFCVRPPRQPGRVCARIHEPEPETPRADLERYFLRFDGCACRPNSSSDTYSYAPECGSFPCTPSGCYVRKCSSDGDCGYGFCSHHASSPSDFCVVSDPY
jgi:hypothetical protein